MSTIPVTTETAAKPTRERFINTTEAILHPTRLAALQKCDTDVITYNPTSFLPVIFHLKGRNLNLIALPLFLLLLWGISWCIIFEFNTSLQEQVEPLEDLISPLLVPVSFLLVFRLGRAAVRFWDARAALGRLVEGSRVLSSTALVHCYAMNKDSEDEEGEENESADLFVRWLCAYPVAVKNFLRPLTAEDNGRRGSGSYHCVNGQRNDELGTLLNMEDREDLLRVDDARYGPILVLNQLRYLAHEISFQNRRSRSTGVSNKNRYNSGEVYRQLNDEIDALTAAWGAMERINLTPLPFAYVAHLRTFLLIYLIFWHIDAISRNGWISLPTLFVGSWGLLGIEAASVECERPFRWSSNHLALGKMCIVVARNVSQTIDDVKLITKRKQQRQKRQKGNYSKFESSYSSDKQQILSNISVGTVGSNTDTWSDENHT